MAIGDLSFAYRPDQGETPDTLAKRREVAEAMMAPPPEQASGGGMGDMMSGMMGGLGGLAGGGLGASPFDGLDLGGTAVDTPSMAPSMAPEARPLGPLATMAQGEPPAMTMGGDFSSRAASVIPRLSRDLGITPEQAAGIVGQLGHESEGLKAINERNPVVPGSRGGYGWAQWTGPRRRQFESWAADNGLDVASPEANYGFLLHELKNTPERKVLDRIRRAPDAVSAGRLFTSGFLRPGIPNQPSRDAWTKRALMTLGSF